MDLEKAAEELKDEFEVSRKELPSGEVEMSLYKDQRKQVTVVADSLRAILSPFMANLSQREAKPFTKKDQRLREKVFEIYMHQRPTPFPWQWAPEPKYETEE